MPITPLPAATRHYLKTFDLAAVCRWRDGRLGVRRDPSGADEAWWCRAKDAKLVKRAAKANGQGIVAAAAALKVPLTSHDAIVERVRTAQSKIDAALEAARRRGDLGFFNTVYKQRRQAARAAGHGFMSYSQAYGRLCQAITAAAANDGQLTRSLILSVFEKA